MTRVKTKQERKKTSPGYVKAKVWVLSVVLLLLVACSSAYAKYRLYRIYQLEVIFQDDGHKEWLNLYQRPGLNAIWIAYNEKKECLGCPVAVGPISETDSGTGSVTITIDKKGHQKIATVVSYKNYVTYPPERVSWKRYSQYLKSEPRKQRSSVLKPAIRRSFPSAEPSVALKPMITRSPKRR
ncbi:hypothetical protein [Sansalvadorimonas verongulae]|uniref:hypothetical protein n=1 Tax=Sansalvadorimonas verongulae TaxID=2172824 RepID=UPI0012BCC1C0|nr:hypothetical protein [Sansalvadorimonas verongulae]MTI14871.1 hypothetical protein [Sansalvadorimonas verongulae]